MTNPKVDLVDDNRAGAAAGGAMGRPLPLHDRPEDLEPVGAEKLVRMVAAARGQPRLGPPEDSSELVGMSPLTVPSRRVSADRLWDAAMSRTFRDPA